MNNDKIREKRMHEAIKIKKALGKPNISEEFLCELMKSDKELAQEAEERRRIKEESKRIEKATKKKKLAKKIVATAIAAVITVGGACVAHQNDAKDANDANEVIYVGYPFSEIKSMREYKLVVIKNGPALFENEEGEKFGFVNGVSAQELTVALIDQGIIKLEEPYQSQTENHNKTKL